MRSGFSRAALAGGAIVLVFAATTAEAKATKAQKEKVKEAMELYPSPVTVPLALSDVAFDRATEWMSIAPEHRLGVATDNSLQTLRLTEEEGGSSMDLVCSVRRLRAAEHAEISANCLVDNPFAAGEGRRAEALLRRYIMTGEEQCLNNGERWDDAAACLLACSSDGQQCDALPVEESYPEMAAEEAMVVGSCTLDQIISMVQSGLVKEQVMAACGGG